MDVLEVNRHSFQVLKLLGKGKGGYSYLVTDGKGEYVLKQIHHEPCSYYTFGDKLASELSDYERLCHAGVRMPRLLDVDREQERILKEYIPGSTVYELVREGRLDPALTAQAWEIGEDLRKQGLNIDYFPTNFVERDGLLYYIDYECNVYDPRWSFPNWGMEYWSKTEAFLAYEREREK